MMERIETTKSVVLEGRRRNTFYIVLVRGQESKVVREGNSFAQFQKWAKEGWVEVWDSAPSRKAGYRYAYLEYGALPGIRSGFVCRTCKKEPAEGMFRGKKYNVKMKRFMPYYGRACARCVENEEFVGELIRFEED